MSYSVADMDNSDELDSEYATDESISFIPMLPGGGGPQDTVSPDGERDQIDNLVCIWTVAHSDSLKFRNKANGESYKGSQTGLSKIQGYVSVDNRRLAGATYFDLFSDQKFLYEITDIRPDGGVRTRYDLVRVARVTNAE